MIALPLSFVNIPLSKSLINSFYVAVAVNLCYSDKRSTTQGMSKIMICRLASLIDERNLKLPDAESGKRSRRLTQRKLAEQTGIASTTLSRLYNNDFTRVDTSTVERLCEYFSCDIGDLFILKETAEDQSPIAPRSHFYPPKQQST